MAELAPDGADEIVTSLAGAQRALARHRLAWVGQRAADCLPLARLAAPEAIISCEGGLDAVLLARMTGARLVSLEDAAPHRGAWSNASVEALAELTLPPATTTATSSLPSSTLQLLAYCATPGWERRAARSGGALRLLAPAAALKERLDDKVHFRAALADLGLPVIPCAAVPAAALSFADLARRFGVPFIVQAPVGASGVGTYEVHTPDQLVAVRDRSPSEPRWLVSRFMGRASLNVNALALPDRVVVAPPSVQMVGLAPLTHSSTIYCGNDFGAAREHSPAVRASVAHQTLRIGRWLSELGYAGLFGVDFVVAPDGPYAMELNPRFQGSTGLLGQWEWMEGRVPLAVLHCLHWLGHPLHPDLFDAPTDLPPDAEMAQAIFHWTADTPAVIHFDLAPGVYTFVPASGLRWLRPGLGIDECAPGELVLSGLPPAGGAVIEPGATVLRVLARARLAAPDGRELTPWGAALAAHITRLIARAAQPPHAAASP